MQTILIVSSVVVLIVGVGYLATNSNNDSSAPQALVGSAAEPVVEMALQDEPESVTEQEATVSTVGSYETYDEEKIAQSEAKHILLFFHATWCPGCRALDAEITENIDKLPAVVAIYKLDYDTETTLKQQYGITMQHSVIAIDRTGTAVGKVSSPATLEDILTAL